MSIKTDVHQFTLKIWFHEVFTAEIFVQNIFLILLLRISTWSFEKYWFESWGRPQTFILCLLFFFHWILKRNILMRGIEFYKGHFLQELKTKMWQIIEAHFTNKKTNLKKRCMQVSWQNRSSFNPKKACKFYSNSFVILKLQLFRMCYCCRIRI